jgi:hypothetical protein
MPVPSHTTRPLHEGMPGAVTVSVTAFQAGDPKFQRGEDRAGIEECGSLICGSSSGRRGRRNGPAFGPETSRLKQWANSDPGTTYLEIKFRFVPGPR